MELKNLAQVGVIILAAIIVFVVGAIVIQSLHDSQVVTLTETVNNESITLSNGTAVLLAHQNVVAASESIRTGNNNTLLIRGKEYSINNGSGAVTLTYIVYNNNVSNITYQKTRPSNNAAVNASNQGTTFIRNVSDQFGLLGTVIIFGVIILAVIGFLVVGRGRRQSGGGFGTP